MKTFLAKAETVERKWWIIDAKDQVIGRIASEAAMLLRGKHKPIYTTYVDTGDFVIILNARKARFTGNKEEDKIYWHHTGYVGGIKGITAAKLREKKPEELIYHAIKGMLPKGPLGRQMYRKLKVYAENNHPHLAQKPEAWKSVRNAF
jgi:large subunit ribosomal protein L13